MKITKKQYDEAQAKLPKLRKAEEIVKQWDEAIKSMPTIDGMEVTAVEITPFGPAVTCKPKEQHVPGQAGRGAA